MPSVVAYLLLLLTAAAVDLDPLSVVPDGYPRDPAIDVLAYRFHVEIADHADSLQGVAAIEVARRGPADRLELDLVGSADDGSGMTVLSVERAATNELVPDPLPPATVGPIEWEHREDRLHVALGDPDDPALDRQVVVVRYRGRPADGLTFGSNRHGDRTVFSDNWPDRARHWLPSVDHPSDKAMVGFVIEAPAGYQAIASGELFEETDLPGGRRRSYWQSEVPLATKVMALGIAAFAVRHEEAVRGVRLSTWAWPQDREAGIVDFAPTADALAFFVDRLGPFPYDELASVQSTTRWGGMENAGNIFYDEDRVDGDGGLEALIAHEIAHQWFGDAVTESDWRHTWLSEGFATYLSALYLEERQGVEVLRQRMADDRRKVIEHRRQNPGSAIVDRVAGVPRDLAGAEIYQAGSWVLHMLRERFGDERLWRALRRFYAQRRHLNASSADFRDAFEAECACELDDFFERWLLRSELPRVDGSWSWQGRRLEVELVQLQEGEPWPLTVDVEALASDGRRQRWSVELEGRSTTSRLRLPFEPTAVHLDPDVRLLAEMPELLPRQGAFQGSAPPGRKPPGVFAP